jgi:Ca2+-binding RTX toxin-like protein
MKVFDANGVARTSELPIDGGSGNSRDMAATALADGGFAVAYTDNAFGSGTDDIGMKIFNADGTSRTGFILANAGDTGGAQGQAATTQLSNGFIMVSWTNVASQTSRFSVMDTAGKVILAPQDLFSAFENITETTLTALAGGQIAALGTGHDQQGSTSISGQVGSVVRQTIGDGTSETLSGDDLTDIMVGNCGDDILKGLGGADNLCGGIGKDTLDGGKGIDKMIGGTGDDIFYVDNAKDVIFEANGQGADLIASTISYVLSTGTEVETLRTTSNGDTAAINLTGNEFGQTVLGNAGANTLSGVGGNDVLLGLAGNDKLLGGYGDDKLSGGLGFDKMAGGTGKDVFLFTALDESGIGAAKADQITDFAAGDKIDISKIDAIANPPLEDADRSRAHLSQHQSGRQQASLAAGPRGGLRRRRGDVHRRRRRCRHDHCAGLALHNAEDGSQGDRAAGARLRRPPDPTYSKRERGAAIALRLSRDSGQSRSARRAQSAARRGHPCSRPSRVDARCGP